MLTVSVVEPAIVDAEAQGAVLLLGEDDVGAPGRLGGAQTAAVQVFLQLLLQLVEFLRRHSAQWTRIWLRSVLELNLMHDACRSRRVGGDVRQLVREHCGELFEQFLAQRFAARSLDRFGTVVRHYRGERGGGCRAFATKVDEVQVVEEEVARVPQLLHRFHRHFAQRHAVGVHGVSAPNGCAVGRSPYDFAVALGRGQQDRHAFPVRPRLVSATEGRAEHDVEARLQIGDDEANMRSKGWPWVRMRSGSCSSPSASFTEPSAYFTR